MNRGPKGSYTKEFREQAVKRVLVDGLSELEAARRLSLSNKTLANWVRAARKSTLTKVGKQQTYPRRSLLIKKKTPRTCKHHSECLSKPGISR